MALGRILLVEDTDADAELTLRALRKHHLANEVLRLRNGAQGLDYLYRRGEYADRDNGNPAVILLDLKMPMVNGMEVLSQLKGDPNLSMIPVVLMTSSREAPDLEEAYRLGVNAYVVKPVDFNDFIAAVEQTGAFWGIINEPPLGSKPES